MKISSIYVTLSLLLASAFASCNFLDVADDYFSDEINSDSIFTSKRNLEAYMWDISRMFPDEGRLFTNPRTPSIYATDEAFTLVETRHGYDGVALLLGEISPTNMRSFGEEYRLDYQAVRRCNTILSRIDEAKDLTPSDRANVLGYVYFFRAYAYYRLLLNFGPVIILGDDVLETNGDKDYYNRSRATYDEMVDYICHDFETAAQWLPVRQAVMNFGRPTKGACYGLIARLRTYQASPAYNGGDAAHKYFGSWTRSADGVHYVSQTYDESRWAEAAAACLRVMKMTENGVQLYRLHTVESSNATPQLPLGVDYDDSYYTSWPNGAKGIDPYHSYADMFNGESVISSNPEFVWARYSADLREATRNAFPLRKNGWNNWCVTQKVIDAYRMSDGRNINNSSQQVPYSEDGFTSTVQNFSGYRLNAGVSNMYVNREMRFYASIGFSECYWPMTSATSTDDHDLTITYYFDSANGKQQSNIDFPITGYVLKKWVHPSDAWAGTNCARMEKPYAMIRYADILLMYAEALNHLTQSYQMTVGNEFATIFRDPEAIRDAIGQVRHRAGLPAPSPAEISDPDKVQKLIEQERMVEFLCENNRYFDVRRWGIYEESETEPFMGMNTDGNKDSYYRRVTLNTSRVGKRIVNRKLMFLPIPQEEVIKVPLLDQNPGW
ncbi:MAG: RagB/SusD family nutrient uptake outer membrane protein [Muribaculaceae bacterium]